MRMPESLTSLVNEGIIEEVLRPLMSGKEAQIYLVMANGRPCVAKIYKEAQNRTFKHRADYTEGRKVRNSRDQRAIDKRSKHGKGQDEAAWRSTEVDMIYRLQAAGVRVPTPYHFIDGVLVMELVTDGHGEPAPRLGEVDFSPEEATAIYDKLIREVVRMLCAGVVHGDLSDFNVLLSADGPVIIDLPQAVDPSKNQNARKLLLRDVDNLHRFLARFLPEARRLPYAEEMWALFESNQLTPESPLRGQYRPSRKKADTEALLELIGEVNEDERRRRAATQPQTSSARPRRVEIVIDKSHPRGKPTGNNRPQSTAFANHAAKAAGLHARQAPRPPRPPHQPVTNQASGNGNNGNGNNARNEGYHDGANSGRTTRGPATRGPANGGHTTRGPAARGQGHDNGARGQANHAHTTRAPRGDHASHGAHATTVALPHQRAAEPATTQRRNRRPKPPPNAAVAQQAAVRDGGNERSARPQQARPQQARPQQARPPRPAANPPRHDADLPRYTTSERPQRPAPRHQHNERPPREREPQQNSGQAQRPAREPSLQTPPRRNDPPLATASRPARRRPRARHP